MLSYVYEPVHVPRCCDIFSSNCWENSHVSIFLYYFGFFSNFLHVRTLFLLLVLFLLFQEHVLELRTLLRHVSMRQGDGPCGAALLINVIFLSLIYSYSNRIENAHTYIFFYPYLVAIYFDYYQLIYMTFHPILSFFPLYYVWHVCNWNLSLKCVLHIKSICSWLPAYMYTWFAKQCIHVLP